MKFAMKEALVLTISYGGVGREEHRTSPRFVFYIGHGHVLRYEKIAD